ncbi:MAG: N-acetylmuramoyl-L-alanine amidase [Aquificota bacterium]|nr:N-acetylmuramoyl-L-alanine amidase [Aquificota bacterium]
MSPRSLISFKVLLIVLVALSYGKVIGSKYGIYRDKVRIVFELSEKRDFRVFTLENPRRIVIDIFGESKVGKLSLPVDMRYRVGRHRWGVRIVLLYDADFSVKYFRLRNPHRIVLDIYREENDIYLELVRILGEEKPENQAPAREPETVAVSDGKDQIAKLIEDIRSKPLTVEKRVIVIDPGHGGKDPGAVGYGGLKEKEVNLAIALKVADFLKKDGRFKVILTRKGDYFVPLHRRAEKALKNRADLLISIHADAAPGKDPRAKGTRVFALSYRRAVEKKRQIIRNKRYARLVLGDAAGIKSAVVKRVLADLAMDVTLYESVFFARLLAKELKNVVGREVYFKGINRAGFAVLKTPGIPSVLVETAFITNPSEARKLRDPEFQRRVAWAIYRAVVRYFYGDDFGRKLVKYQ